MATDFATRLAQQTDDEPIAVSWWTRGGKPGPAYTSDKIDLQATRGDASGSYVRARADQKYDPPFLLEAYAGPVPQKLWRRFVDTLAQERWYEVRFAWEVGRPPADALKDTIRIEIGPSVFEKTLVESGQDELAGAKQARHQVAQLLIDKGEHKVHSKPK